MFFDRNWMTELDDRSRYHWTKAYIPTPLGIHWGMHWKRIKPSLISLVHYVFNTCSLDSQRGGNVWFCQV